MQAKNPENIFNSKHHLPGSLSIPPLTESTLLKLPRVPDVRTMRLLAHGLHVLPLFLNFPVWILVTEMPPCVKIFFLILDVQSFHKSFKDNKLNED